MDSYNFSVYLCRNNIELGKNTKLYDKDFLLVWFSLIFVDGVTEMPSRMDINRISISKL